MTTSLPLQCLACDWLDRSAKQPFSDQPVVEYCAAFPSRIPDAILDGGDHRTPIGGEVDGITFAMADGEGDYFRAWERLNASLRTASPQAEGEKSLKRTYIRDEEGKFDDVPGVGVDVDLPGDGGDEEPNELDEEFNDHLPQAYLAKYGKVIGSSNITGEQDLDGEFLGDLLESSRFDVTVTEKRGFHVAHGVNARTVVQELDPFTARVLKDIAWDIDDGTEDLPHTDEATGVRFEPAADGNIVVTWADGTTMPIEASRITDLGEALDAGVDTFESEFGKRKAATGRRLSIKRTYVRDGDGQFADVPGIGNDAVANAMDKLKLGKLAPAGFTVRSSKKIKNDYADVGVAEVDSPDGPQTRVGLITAESGKWDAGFSGEGRKAQLRQQIAEKQALFDSDDEQADGLEDELYELRQELEDLDAERTAILAPQAMADLRRQLDGFPELAKANKAKQDATLKAAEAIEEQIDDLADEFSDPELERRIRKAQGHLGSLQYRLRLVRADPKYAHYIPEAEADVAEAERELEPLLARRAELMPSHARMQLEDLERQQRALNEGDIDDIISSAEVTASNGSRVHAEIWGSDDVDSDWVATRLYVLNPGETTDDADQSDDHAYFRGLRGLNKLIAGFEPEQGAPKSAIHHRGTGSARASFKRSSTGETMQLKSFQPEVKAVGKEGDMGTATIVVATLNVVDKDGDVTLPGFFGEQWAQLVPTHDWDHVWMGKGRVYERGDQCLVDLKFNLKIPEAKNWYEAVKFDHENPPSLANYSYGYNVLDGGSRKGTFKGQSVRYLTPRPDGSAGGKVFEVSPVLLGAGEGTGTVDVKSRARERIAERRANAAVVGGMFKGGLAVHESPTVGRSWDGVKTVAALAEDALPSQLRTVFAWVDPAGDPELKASYQFPHHHGVSGPANIRACLAGIATLNGAAGGCDLSESDRKSVYDHLASHLKDADREPPTLRTDVGAATGKNLRFGDEAANVLASVAGLIDRASDVMVLRARKGKGLTANTADLLSWVRDEVKRLDSLLSQPIEADDEPSTHMTDEEIASVVLAAVARLHDDN